MKPIFDTTGAPVFSFKRGPASARKPRSNPEHALQVSVKQFLILALPPQIEWTSSLAGAHLGPAQRSKMKASGLRPGFPDLVFIIRRRAYWIELKSDVGVLSADQRRVLDALHPESWAVCRSVDDVAAALTKWGVELRRYSFT